jgi:hypothetical protein
MATVKKVGKDLDRRTLTVFLQAYDTKSFEVMIVRSKR